MKGFEQSKIYAQLGVACFADSLVASTERFINLTPSL